VFLGALFGLEIQWKPLKSMEIIENQLKTNENQ